MVTSKNSTGSDVTGVKLYLKAANVIIPKIGAVAVGNVLQVFPKQFESIKTGKTIEGAQCDLILLDSVFCIPNQKDPYIIKRINSVPLNQGELASLISPDILTEITSIARKQEDLQLTIAVKMQGVSKLQKEACELDREKRELEIKRQSLEQKERDNWMPEVFLKGVILQKEVSKHQVKAATVLRKTSNTLLFNISQIYR